MIAKNDEKMKEISKLKKTIANIKYEIKYKTIIEQKWHTLKIYKSLKKAFEILNELEKEKNDFITYRIEVIE